MKTGRLRTTSSIPSVVINYAGGGSGQGIKDIKAGTVDFAGSDALLSDKDYKDAPGLQMIPTVAGAVVLAYNVKGITTSITLDANTVVGHLSGQDRQLERPGDCQAESRRQVPRPADQRRAPLGWLRHDQHLYAVPFGRQ